MSSSTDGLIVVDRHIEKNGGTSFREIFRMAETDWGTQGIYLGEGDPPDVQKVPRLDEQLRQAQPEPAALEWLGGANHSSCS